ncbi:MAG: thermonuclease family protein [Beijerinckiaceae bacterium]
MSHTRRFARLIASLAVLAAAGGALYLTRGAQQDVITGVAEVLDGDSLKVNGVEIRLKGIDAPEFNQTCRVSGQETPCGRESRAQLRRFSGAGLITCVGEGVDRFGRMLARCTVRGADINAAMVRSGHAISFGAYLAEETEAKGAYRGLWAGTFERPRDWRARHGGQPN